MRLQQPTPTRERAAPPRRPPPHPARCGCAGCCGVSFTDLLGWPPDEAELDEEISRSSGTYIQWVQRSLNRLLGLALDVDGISGPMTRSAVRDFQARQRLDVDGIVGPDTEAALMRAGAEPPPTSASTPGAGSGGATPVNTLLPASGPGFYTYDDASARYGQAAVIRALTSIAASWQRSHPGGPRLGFGHISKQGGGPLAPHSTHQAGLNVDVRPVRSDGREAGVSYRDSGYSRTLTQALVNLIRGNPVLAVSSILFNDPAVSGVKPWDGHDDHLHLSFVQPSAEPAPAPAPSPDRAGAPAGSAATLRQRLAQVALGEWESWQRGQLKENSSAVFERLVQYWMGVGMSRGEAEGRARLSQGEDPAGYWSAAFISWAVRQAGAVPGQFAFAGAHSTFIAAAYQNRLQRNSLPFKAYGTSEVAPRVGDLVAYAYSTTVPATVATVKPDTSGYHTDIVVAIDRAASTITVIGGNVSNSVSAKTLSISTGGFLIQASPKYFGVIQVG